MPKTKTTETCATCGAPLEEVHFRSFEKAYCPACADEISKRIDERAGMPFMPYETLRDIIKVGQFPTAGGKCIAPTKCEGHIVFDPVQRCHRCDKCGYGF